MASTSTPDDQTNGDNIIPKSRFDPTMCLTEWWLVKTDNDFQGRRLAVAGFTSREGQARRVFSSAPIIKRYDVFTVETTDGICVILKGFLNRDRTVENGFPSDVDNHFLFGFPPYWKEYVENFMGEESSSKDVSRFNSLKMQSPQPGTMEGEQPHEKDSESQDKMDVKGLRKSKKTKSLAVPLAKKSDMDRDMSSSEVILSDLEGRTRSVSSLKMKQKNNLIEKIPSHCVLSMGSKVVEFAAADCEPGGKNNWNFEVSELHGSTYQIELSKLDAASTKDEFEQICRTPNQDKDSRKVKTKGNIKKAKSKTTRSLSTVAATNNQKDNAIPEINSLSEKAGASAMKTQRKLAYETPDKEKKKVPRTSPQSTSEWILSQSDGRVRTRSMSSLQMKQKTKQIENITSYCVSSKGSEKVKFAAADCEPGGRNNRNFEVSELHGPRDEIKLSKETPDKEKEKVPSSHQSGSLNRSRLGRLLMPTLEFWRNQRAIYDVDRTITGIEEGIHAEHQKNGNRSTPLRKRSRRT